MVTDQCGSITIQRSPDSSSSASVNKRAAAAAAAAMYSYWHYYYRGVDISGPFGHLGGPVVTGQCGSITAQRSPGSSSSASLVVVWRTRVAAA